jgi:hypothetical protein
MAVEPIGLRVVRESLEGVLAPTLHSAVIFEALEEFGQSLPSTTDDTMKFVRGPLHRVLAKRVGGHEADLVVSRIEQVLRTAPTIPPPPEEDKSEVQRRRDRDATTEIQIVREQPVFVMVVAAGTSMVMRLGAALGPAVVAPLATAELSQVRDRVYAEPPVTLVDATDFSSIDPQELASALMRLPSRAIIAVWGFDLPYGRTVALALEQHNREVVALARKEGVDPLLDLIKSRQQS